MKKGIKISAVIGLIVLFLVGGFVFWFSTLPKAQEVAPPKKFIATQKSTIQKIEVNPEILKITKAFVSTFFLFDQEKMKDYQAIQGVTTDTAQYFEQYGKGTGITYTLKQATQDNASNVFITYDVTGTYQMKQQKFSMVINVGQTYSTTMTIQSYTVVAYE